MWSDKKKGTEKPHAIHINWGNKNLKFVTKNITGMLGILSVIRLHNQYLEKPILINTFMTINASICCFFICNSTCNLNPFDEF